VFAFIRKDAGQAELLQWVEKRFGATRRNDIKTIAEQKLKQLGEAYP